MTVEITPRGTHGWKMPRAAIVAMGLIPGFYRLLKGRGMGATLVLTTVGAKTGQKRDAHLTAFPDGVGWLVVASKGGSATPRLVHQYGAAPGRCLGAGRQPPGARQAGVVEGRGPRQGLAADRFAVLQLRRLREED
jgi:deazaflavin-dependent oxidoreductase (nitroreductase family)